MTGYYKRFIQNYALIAKLLTELTKSGRPESVEWNKTTELAFQTMIMALISSTLLKNLNADNVYPTDGFIQRRSRSSAESMRYSGERLSICIIKQEAV